MKPNDTLNKAYGHVPKEVGTMYNIDWPRGFKYYWLKFVRSLMGR